MGKARRAEGGVRAVASSLATQDYRYILDGRIVRRTVSVTLGWTVAD